MLVSTVYTSCTDNANNWGVDPNANGNRTWAPTSINIGDKYGDYVKVYGFHANGATSYEFELSKVDFEEALEGDIISNKIGKILSTDTITLSGLEPKTDYYLRVRALKEGKAPSTWVYYCDGKGATTFNSGKLAALTYNITMDESANKYDCKLPVYWHNGVITMVPTNTAEKMEISKESGSGRSYVDGSIFTTRLKVGAATSAENKLTVSVVAPGTITIYAYSGSGNDSRTLTLMKNGEQIFFSDGDGTLPGTNEKKNTSYSAHIDAGEVTIECNGSMYVSSVQFEVDPGQKFTEEDVLDKYGPAYPVEPEPEPEPEPQPEEKADLVTLTTTIGTWSEGNLSVTAVNDDSKMLAEAKSITFKDEQAFSVRLKTNSGSTATNKVLVTLKAPGTLTIYAQSGSSSDPRTIDVTDADGNVVKSLEIAATGDTDNDKKPQTVENLAAGTYELVYNKTLYFWGFKLVASGDAPTPGPGPDPTQGFTGTFTFAGITADDVTTTEGTWGTATFNDEPIPSVSSLAGKELNLSLKSQPNVNIAYTNSSSKSNIIKCAQDFLIVDGKGGMIKINNLKERQTIIVTFSAKGGTPAIMAANKGCTGESVTSTATSDLKTATFTATASEVVLKENNGGFRLTSVEVAE